MTYLLIYFIITAATSVFDYTVNWIGQDWKSSAYCGIIWPIYWTVGIYVWLFEDWPNNNG